jgi:hypothetical protein
LIPIFAIIPGAGPGITTYLENGGALENAKVMAAHPFVRMMQLYDGEKRNGQVYAGVSPKSHL